MKRNMVDGIGGCTLQLGITERLYDFAKYVVDNPFYKSGGGLQINLHSWNKIPATIQEIMIKTLDDFEKEYTKIEAKERQEAKLKMINQGIQFYSLEPNTAEWFVDTAYTNGWNDYQKRFPNITPSLKRFLSP